MIHKPNDTSRVKYRAQSRVIYRARTLEGIILCVFSFIIGSVTINPENYSRGDRRAMINIEKFSGTNRLKIIIFIM